MRASLCISATLLAAAVIGCGSSEPEPAPPTRFRPVSTAPPTAGPWP